MPIKLFRGHSHDYDEWEKLGNPGWGYRDILKYFKKSEKFYGEVPDKEKYHGTEGRLGVQTNTNFRPIDAIALEAMEG